MGIFGAAAGEPVAEAVRQATRQGWVAAAEEVEAPVRLQALGGRLEKRLRLVGQER